MASNSHLRVDEREWEQGAKLGVFATLGHFRRLLQHGPLSPDDTDGLIATLALLEEFIDTVWGPDFARYDTEDTRPTKPDSRINALWSRLSLHHVVKLSYRKAQFMVKVLMATGLTLALFAGAAYADSSHECQGNSCNGGGATTVNVDATGGKGGSAYATGGAAIVNTHVTQGQEQGQLQGQRQGQKQGQGQGQSQAATQSQSADNAGNHQTTKFEAPTPVGLAIAPGLTAGGTGVCLGSVSIGASGPFAGLSFGITKVDKGCERRSGAVILWQMGFRDAAVRLLANDDEIRKALVGGNLFQPQTGLLAPGSLSMSDLGGTDKVQGGN